MCVGAWWAVILFGVLSGAVCFNIDVRYPIVFRPSDIGDNSSLNIHFGQAVAFHHSRDQTNILVGAPLFPTAKSDFTQYGALYKCSIKSPTNKCENMYIVHGERRDFFGASIDSDITENGLFSVCAPGARETKWPKDHLTGMCYVFNGDLTQWLGKEIIPDIENGLMYFNDRQMSSYPSASLGFSVHLADNGRDFVMGTPSLRYHLGGVMKFTITIPQTGLPSTRKYYTKTDYFFESFLNSFYFGYSVSSGYFSLPKLEKQYLIGAPAETLGRGAIYIMVFFQETGMSQIAKRSGDQVGEYFGGSVLGVDLNNDGVTDVVVGAPHHVSRKNAYSQGLVYVFISGYGSLFSKKLLLRGSDVSKAAFGKTLGRVYDLDNDGYEDLAVGAPDENEGTGAIYIYRGSKKGVRTKYSQRILARELGSSLRGFGFAISRGLDVDGNFYRDISVGSYGSNEVVLLRSKPVVTIHARLIPIKSQITTNQSEFRLLACLMYSGYQAPSRITIEVQVETVSNHPDIKLKRLKSHSKKVRFVLKLILQTETCENITLTQEKNRTKNYALPIKLVMAYNISQSKRDYNGLSYPFVAEPSSRYRNFTDEFCYDCPVVDTNLDNQLSTDLSIPFTFNCGSNDICESDLVLSYDFVGLKKNDFIFGSNKEINLQLNITSTKEPAVKPVLTLHISYELFVALPPGCVRKMVSNETMSIVCSLLPNPLEKGEQSSLTFALDGSELPESMTSLNFNVSASTSSVDVNNKNNILNITMNIIHEADLAIEGSINDELEIIRDQPADKYDENLWLSLENLNFAYELVVHRFTIVKHMRSPVRLIEAKFQIPETIYMASGKSYKILNVGEPVASVGNENISCKLDRGKFDELYINYKVVSKGNTNKINFTLQSLEPFIEQNTEKRHLNLRCNDKGDDSLPKIKCSTIRCDNFPLKTSKEYAVFKLRMHVNLSMIHEMASIGIDVVRLETKGSVDFGVGASRIRATINKLPDNATSVTSFIAKDPMVSPIPVGLIVGSVIGSIVLLLIIATVLYRFGFFKRKTKEELDRIMTSQN